MKYTDDELETKFQELVELINKIENESLRNGVHKIFIDKKEDILKRSGSPDCFEDGKYVKGGHHFFKGGLLCHLLVLLKLPRGCKLIRKSCEYGFNYQWSFIT